jgi:hypothetical protein
VLKTIMRRVLYGWLLWLCTVAPVGAALDTSGLKYVVPGATCRTTKAGIAAATLFDLKRASDISGGGDREAMGQMYARGHVIDIPQMTVFVEEAELPYAQIRPEGRLDRLWVSAFRLDCPPPK